MNAPPRHDDGPDVPEPRRGVDYPADGRRNQDASVHAMVEHLRELTAAITADRVAPPVAPVHPWGFRQWMTQWAAITALASSAAGLVVWLGGRVQGPGAENEGRWRAAASSDSLARVERSELRDAVLALNRTQARMGRDMCLYVFKREQNECLVEYDTRREGGAPATTGGPIR